MLNSVSYWDDRYRQTAEQPPYDWYLGYSSLRHLLNPIHFSALSSGKILDGALLQPTAPPSLLTFPSRENCRTLILGCGNSVLGEQMQRDGWTGPIVNVDFSNVVIEQLKNTYNDAFYLTFETNQRIRPQPMSFVCADVTEPLEFDDGSFDLIVCKATLDAVLCGPGYKATATRMIQEVARLLAPEHGVFFLVTNGKSDDRIEYLEHKTRIDHYWESVFCHCIPGTRVGGTR
ncbi:hypothetical protein MPSEU_000941500 [Mayamaea pseudoterrestris]|nr:hypothetical protein MPSEU_000941500 [Mayamaea pseudoterrestris]